MYFAVEKKKKKNYLSLTWLIYDDKSPPCLASAISFCCFVSAFMYSAKVRTLFSEAIPKIDLARSPTKGSKARLKNLGVVMASGVMSMINFRL